MRTALLIEALQVIGGLLIVFFAGRRLLGLRRRQEEEGQRRETPRPDPDHGVER